MKVFIPGDIVMYRCMDRWAATWYRVVNAEHDEVWMERIPDGRPAHADAAELELACLWTQIGFPLRSSNG